ncbi:hypothetical protein PYW08_007931 [Mythimna loreyi]|uniref:Uncharacterized protein n=1 Tax=Mythimna loreyi TaxID=667449 RepID=A0ACC2QBY6_9NEOP|nr:hypothetical protein PYW08_007931 [Mythimna loreyi]
MDKFFTKNFLESDERSESDAASSGSSGSEMEEELVGNSGRDSRSFRKRTISGDGQSSSEDGKGSAPKIPTGSRGGGQSRGKGRGLTPKESAQRAEKLAAEGRHPGAVCAGERPPRQSGGAPDAGADSAEEARRSFGELMVAALRDMGRKRVAKRASKEKTVLKHATSLSEAFDKALDKSVAKLRAELQAELRAGPAGPGAVRREAVGGGSGQGQGQSRPQPQPEAGNQLLTLVRSELAALQQQLQQQQQQFQLQIQRQLYNFLQGKEEEIILKLVKKTASLNFGSIMSGDKLTTKSSHPTLQLTNYYGAGGGPPPYRRFQQQLLTTVTTTPQRTQQPLAPSKDYALAFVHNLGNRFGTDDSASSPLHPFTFATPARPVQQTTVKPSPPPKLEYSPPVTTTPRPVNRFTPSLATDECGVIDQVLELVYKGQSYERGRIPWLVAIFRTKRKGLEFRCGGTLVTDRHVVTAAHCKWVRSETVEDRELVVKLGVHALDDWADDVTLTVRVMSAAMHDRYDGSSSLQNDIMVMTLMKRVQFSRYIRPACLWSGDTTLSRVVGQTGDVAGWGDRGDAGVTQSDEPQLVRMPIVSTKDCRANNSFFHEVTFDTTFCAGDLKGAGPCTGDSGSGLYLRDDGKWRLRGVVSLSLQSSSRTCNLNEYVVFTDAAQYLPWIRNILSQKYFD